MPPVVFPSLSALEENPTEVFLEITSVLLRLANNVIDNPRNPKFRSLRLANPTVANKLLPAVGAMECLFEMGFQEAEDSLVLPENTSLDHLKKMRDQILLKRDSMIKTSSSQTVNSLTQSASNISSFQSANVATARSTPTAPRPAPTPAQTAPRSPVRKLEFLDRLVAFSEGMVQNTNKELLQRAKNCIPLIELEVAAQEQMRNIQRGIKESQAKAGAQDAKSQKDPLDLSMQELLLVQLLSWFKNKFFSWVNQLPCSFCSGKTEFKRTDDASGLRIEVYVCKACSKETLFPRYSEPGKLLETRRGRCGEWGSCFTLLCQSLGWDARLVIDETDHVWTEVFSITQNRWLHCDPCEDAFDTPLMYELGWKKKLTYIIAYSPDDVQDVTWRYVTNHKAVLERRRLCTETQLLQAIMTQRELRQRTCTESRKSHLRKRTLMELVELMKQPSAKDGDYHGRQSGSLAWRLARGETSSSEQFEPYIWRPSPAEVGRKEMRLQYLPGVDQYRFGESSSLQGWQRGLKSVDNVFRKEEKDWKRVYLARKEGTEKGSLVWHLDTSNSGMVVDSVKLVCSTRVFESGQTLVLLCAGDSCVRLLPGQSDLETDALKGASSLQLRVELTGGNGDAAWQHSQLFRAAIGSSDVGLDIIVKLKNAV